MYAFIKFTFFLNFSLFQRTQAFPKILPYNSKRAEYKGEPPDKAAPEFWPILYRRVGTP
jgi:hypothetical protein